MFDIGFWELSLIAVIGLLILGPERLPRVARTAGLWVSKMKRMVADVKSNIDEELRMEELNALKQTGEKLKEDLETTQKEFKDAGTAFQSSVEEASSAADGVGESVDIVSAIKKSAPTSDEEPIEVEASDTERPVKKEIKKKTTRKVKKKTAADSKKVVKRKSTSRKSVAHGNTRKKTKKGKGLTEDQKDQGYEAQVQAAANRDAQDDSMPNQKPPDHSI